jgi:drug/metabolite transporter (DMT)-like permease
LFVACLAAAFAYAVGGTISKNVKPIAIISWTLIYCLPANIVISYYSIDFRPFEVSINSWLAFIWLGISSSYLAFFFWYGGLSYGGVARVSQLLLLQPAFNLFLSYILLNDPLTAVNLVFTFLIVLTVFIGKNQEILKA